MPDRRGAPLSGRIERGPTVHLQDAAHCRQLHSIWSLKARRGRRPITSPRTLRPFPARGSWVLVAAILMVAPGPGFRPVEPPLLGLKNVPNSSDLDPTSSSYNARAYDSGSARTGVDRLATIPPSSCPVWSESAINQLGLVT